MRMPMSRILVPLAVSALAFACDAQGQTAAPHGDAHAMHGMDMPAQEPAGRPAPDHAHHDMAGHKMTGALGSYTMVRDASGTAWQPDSSPLWAIMGQHGDWSTMVHGYATLVHDEQGGPRGDQKTFVASMLMGMAQRPAGDGILTLRAMGSLDPLMGKNGYPLLLATGETADGRTELVDRQHPHDLFMELAAIYSRPLGERTQTFVYMGLPGEPALGPATYMHRFSGIANPEAPIDHHWLDSTHVTFGVATVGVIRDGIKLESSVFTGREPDENRYDIERPRFDSWSFRATWNPNADLSMQISHGFLNSPEKLHPEENVRRTTASVTWNRKLATGNWQSTLAWGRNDPSDAGEQTTDAFLFDSALQIGRNTIFGRLEHVEKDELFADEPQNPLSSRVFAVSKISLGGFHSFFAGAFALDVGGLVSKYGLPAALRPTYGRDPASAMLFTRFRING
ncbi:MAG TPA: hypothetical protein VFQ57_08880 [Sphingomonas sp.]|jgi:hypothetical protein|nr:hypothetical protein [Sphingomonas sp.]